MATQPDNASVEDKIEKLLRMADGNANENEAATALRLAQKLADAHNLDLGQIGKTGSRKDRDIAKGLYMYQRTLYEELGRLNHCKVWIVKGIRAGEKYKTRLLGSKVNVTIVCQLADYLEDVANRMVRERWSAQQYFSKDAHLFREGMIDRMVERIKERRKEEEAEREREKREQQARQGHPGAATENAIVLISDVAKAEEKANYDYENGEGAWDRKEARQAEWLANYHAKQDAALAEAAAWELAHPEEAARQKAEKAKADARAQREYDARERRREKSGYYDRVYNRMDKRDEKYSSHAYRSGRDTGSTVNLDDQISRENRKGIK